MKKIFLVVAVLICAACQLEASGTMPRHLIPEQRPVGADEVVIENNFSSSKYNVLPYAGVMYFIPSAGVAFRNETYDTEIDFKGTSIVLASAGTISYSKIFSNSKNFNKEGLYRGAYAGVGAGGGMLTALGGQGMMYVPLAVGKTFGGYQGKYGFIDAGCDILFTEGVGLPLPCPTLRVGIRF